MSGLTASQQVLGSPEYNALTKYLSGNIRDLVTAVDAFAESVEDEYKKTANSSDVEALLWRAWEGVVAIAASTSYTSSRRQKLTDFLVMLAYRCSAANGSQGFQFEGMKVWRDLPVLDWELREAWSFGMPLIITTPPLRLTENLHTSRVCEEFEWRPRALAQSECVHCNAGGFDTRQGGRQPRLLTVRHAGHPHCT